MQRAQEARHVTIECVNLRNFAVDAHRTVDDRPFGGGAGMVLMVEPIVKALESVGVEGEEPGKNPRKKHVVATSARGKVFTQSTARAFARQEHLVILAGHYEGYDERVKHYVDEEVSLGDFVLTGGELVAACIVDAVVRLLPGVLKKEAATEEESFFEVSVEELIKVIGEDAILTDLKARGVPSIRLLEYPQYTRPQNFQGKTVPEVLVAGDPKNIRAWQLQQAFHLTKTHRPDLCNP